MPSVSILMPVYNTAKYLKEAMDSMLAQTYQDFELIVLDDCSPDNAQEILATYSDPRIVRYRGATNQGLAMVLNAGIEMARGKYIARMDSDDISMPERLAVQVKYLEEHADIDLCSCGMRLFEAKHDEWVRDADPEKVKVTALFFSPILHASSVWRKDSFESKGLRFRQEMVPAEDYDLWCRALAAGLRLVNLPAVLYKYRIRPDQATENTARTSAKEIEVKRSFVRSIFPELAESELDAASRLTTYEDEKDIENALDIIRKANRQARFFDTGVLEKRLFKFGRARSLQNLPGGFSVKKIMLLGPSYYLRRAVFSKFMTRNWHRLNFLATFKMQNRNISR